MLRFSLSLPPSPLFPDLSLAATIAAAAAAAGEAARPGAQEQKELLRLKETLLNDDLNIRSTRHSLTRREGKRDKSEKKSPGVHRESGGNKRGENEFLSPLFAALD